VSSRLTMPYMVILHTQRDLSDAKRQTDESAIRKNIAAVSQCPLLLAGAMSNYSFIDRNNRCVRVCRVHSLQLVSVC
jgi:hypothetical protein